MLLGTRGNALSLRACVEEGSGERFERWLVGTAPRRKCRLRFGRRGGLGLPAADLFEGTEQGIQGGIQLIERLEEGDTDDAVGHDIARESFESVVQEFSHGFVFSEECLKRRVVGEVLDETDDIKIGRHAASVLLDTSDGLLAEDPGVVTHLDEGFPLIRRETHGAAAKSGADGLKGTVQGGDLGGG